MRKLTVSLLVLISACSESTSTPKGPLPTVRLMRSADGSASAQPAEQWEALVPVCDAMPFRPAFVRFRWATVKDEGGVWISSVTAAVETPGDALVVTLVPDVTVGGASLEAGAPWVDVADVQVKCERKAFRFPKSYEQSLSSLVQLKADGFVSFGGRGWGNATPVSQ
ncbi:MAG: hypothetical protein ACO1OB_10040 [Archangium sp.]